MNRTHSVSQRAVDTVLYTVDDTAKNILDTKYEGRHDRQRRHVGTVPVLLEKRPERTGLCVEMVPAKFLARQDHVPV